MIPLIWKALQRSNPQKSPLFIHSCLFSILQSPREEPLHSSLLESQPVDELGQVSELSSELTRSGSSQVQIKPSDESNSVQEYLRSHGLTESQIKKVVTSHRSRALTREFETKIKPNIELFESLGITNFDISKIINREPKVFTSDAKETVDFFRSHGFTEEQIAMLTMRRPSLYKLSVARDLKPKLEYFRTLGLSDSKIAAILSNRPYALARSLETHIKPSVELLQRLFGSEEKVIKALTGFSRVLEVKLDQVLETNLSILMNNGVDEVNILKCFNLEPCPLLINTKRLREAVDSTRSMGFDPKNVLYLLAIRTLLSMSKSRWLKKSELYQSYGLSEDDVLSAFKRQPLCMIASEEKIIKLMDFYVRKLNMHPSAVVTLPNLMLLSLEKRLLPRCSVLQILLSKGLFEPETIKLSKMFVLTEESFVRRFIIKYKYEAPEIVEAHKGKVPFEGLPVKMKD